MLLIPKIVMMILFHSYKPNQDLIKVKKEIKFFCDPDSAVIFKEWKHEIPGFTYKKKHFDKYGNHRF